MTMKILKKRGICGTPFSYSHERTAARDSVFLSQQLKQRFAASNQPDIMKKIHTNLKNEDKVVGFNTILHQTEEKPIMPNLPQTLNFTSAKEVRFSVQFVRL